MADNPAYSVSATVGGGGISEWSSNEGGAICTVLLGMATLSSIATHVSAPACAPVCFLAVLREFELPETLQLWDALFSDPKRFSLLYDCCVAMLM
jgi:hypothetical protein